MDLGSDVFTGRPAMTNDKLTRRVRWGITKDYKYHSMFAVHPVDDTSEMSMRRFYFFEHEDAELFKKLIDKSCHRRANEPTAKTPVSG